MIRWLVVALALLAWPAWGQTARVQSGEHADFTRLALIFPAAPDWRLTRTAGGYVLSVKGAAPAYRLDDVFRRIPRTRLTAIWADPATGDLRLEVGCACHATAFAFRPETLVIDLRDGPPPPDSPFELAETGVALPPLGSVAARPRARPPGSDAPTRLPFPAPPAPALPADFASRSIDSAAMRRSLVEALGIGATAGLVELDLTADDAARFAPLPGELPLAVLDGPRIDLRLGDAPARVEPGRADCPAPELTDPSGWSDGRPAAQQLADVNRALVGEFDRIDPAAAERGVRVLLHFGFGAEAAGLLRVAPVPAARRQLWDGMARIVDGGTDPDGALIALAGCDDAGALWAALAAPADRLPRGLNRTAVLRSFSALPPHLRRSLGPGLADRFLAAGDAPAATALNEAIMRAGPTPEAQLVSARLRIAEDRPEAAAAELAAIEAPEDDLAAAALADLVELQLAQGLVLQAADLLDLQSRAREYRGTPLGERLARIEVLALAAAGDAAGAFRLAAAMPAVRPDLWQVLARQGTDDDLLTQAVPAPPEAVAEATPPVRQSLAGRLLRLGMPEAALRWVAGLDTADEDLRLLRARAAAQMNDGRGILEQIAGLTGPEAAALRVQALTLLGDPAAAALAAADPQSARRALWQARDWAALASAAGDDPRAEAARLALPNQPPADMAEPLASARALVTESASARVRLRDLLTAEPETLVTEQQPLAP
ncbi:MAG: hypothetical protein IE927_12100 [Rhodobacterales bacterium]|nr:hypothetical protein [Rhodobacterales bacterium]